MKVSIIDDDSLFCLKIEELLGRMDYTFCGKAHSYSEGLDMIKSSLPDIVICDIRIGENKTGIDLANEVKDLLIPFVFVTAYSERDVYVSARQYQLSKFIVKPFDMLTLQGILDDLFKDVIRFTANKSIRGNTLFVRKNNIFEKIDLDSIDYLYSEGNYITLNVGETEYLLKYSLSKLLESSKFQRFTRIHRSYAIHSHKLQKVDFSNKLLSIGSDKELPFGRTYVKDVRELMSTKLK